MYCDNLDYRTKGVFIIYAVSLFGSLCNHLCFIYVNKSISLPLYLVNPITLNDVLPFFRCHPMQVSLFHNASYSASIAFLQFLSPNDSSSLCGFPIEVDREYCIVPFI
jgi:hypothetical protein